MQIILLEYLMFLFERKSSLETLSAVWEVIIQVSSFNFSSAQFYSSIKHGNYQNYHL